MWEDLRIQATESEDHEMVSLIDRYIDGDTKAIQEIVPVRALVACIVKDLERVRSDLRRWGIEHTDVRLQWLPGDTLASCVWYVHSGDASFDLDHHGFWGCGSVGADWTHTQLRELAWALLLEALDGAEAEGEGEGEDASA